MITTIILTYNEAKHLERCLLSIKEISNKIIIVDSFSTDGTIEISKSFGAEVYQNPFINQAKQFQWALDNIDINTDWIIRLDADEYFTPSLLKECKEKLSTLPPIIHGIYLKRRVYFLDKWIRYGGYYPTKILRIWRNGKGSIEQKWMDEHVKIENGQTVEFENDFVDHNLNTLNWWIEKHNQYSTREAVEYLNSKYNFFKPDTINLNDRNQASKKRKFKLNYYYKIPAFLRSFLYFLYRFIIKGGFLDGRKGLIWHFLQGFWYRFLVDAKIYQIEALGNKDKEAILAVLEDKYKIKI